MPVVYGEWDNIHYTFRRVVMSFSLHVILDLVVNLDLRVVALVILWFRNCSLRGPLVPVYHIIEPSGFTSIMCRLFIA